MVISWNCWNFSGGCSMVEYIYLKRSHFPVVLWKNIHRYLCYITGISVFQEYATDTCSEMPAYAQKCFSDMLELGIAYQEAVTPRNNCALKNAGAPGFLWFQQHAEWECISANKPVTASLENWILNVFLFLLLSSHHPFWMVKGFNSFILSLCLLIHILLSERLLFVTI